jgi:NADPH-dependent 2,4-dienoyl-CoA reductase/sulfur reductase-like enzyme
MAHFKYLIIGAGMTADSAVKGIRELDPDGSIALIGKESDPPYNRPPLTKDLWKGKPMEKIWRKTEDKDAEIFLDRTVTSIDPESRKLVDDRGEEFTYDKLLLATGGSPRTLPFGDGQIIYFRTVNDYRHLRELSQEQDHLGVIGAGFIGSEIAAALAMNGKKVTMVFPEEGIGANIYPREISQYLNEYFSDKGVEMLPGSTVKDVKKQGSGSVMVTEQGRKVEVGGVVAGIGIKPNLDLAEAAGLQVNNGIIVDEHLQTSHPSIWAAGDVAEFHNPTLDKRMRVEHEDNANNMGKQAGRNMAGADETYDYLPFFYSDLFDIGYEAVGELDSHLETFTDWKDPFKKGVVYYLKDGRVRGVLLWNVWDTVPKARELIAEAGPFKPADLKGRL